MPARLIAPAPPTLLLISAPFVAAQAPPAGRAGVTDPAGMFAPAAVEEARRALAASEKESRVPVLIETVASLRGASIEQAAARAAEHDAGRGVFVLIAKDEHKLQIVVEKAFHHRLPPDRRDAVRDVILAEFKAGHFDDGLKQGVAALARELRATTDAKAPAATSPLVERDRIRLNLAGARRAVEAAEAKAAAMGLKVNIAVVDDGGHLLAFARMDGARPASASTAQTKATAAATLRAATGPFPPGAAQPDLLVSLGVPAAAAASGGKMTTLYGGVPILVEGQVVGAIGVGGATGDQDAEIARAGAQAVVEGAGPKVK